MAPLLITLIGPGLLGGVVLALLIFHFRWGLRPAPSRPLAPPSPSLINMAHIRIEGIGGLGMVAVALTVALFEPRIRGMMLIGSLLGVALAGVLIAHRRRIGPLPSASHGPTIG